MDYIYIAAGGLVGLIVGLTGVGGGSLMTPILVLGFGITPSIAVGTDLLYAAITKCGGIYFHHKNNTIDWKIVGLLSAGSIPCSIAAIFLLERIRHLGINYDIIIMKTLSFMLILTALIVFGKTRLIAYIHTRHNSHPLVNGIRYWRSVITFLAGCLLGFLVTLSSVGAGAIGAAILLLLYPNKKSINIIGTDLTHAVPLTAIAGAGHLHFGSVDFELLLGLLIGGLPCIYLGSFIGKKLPDKILRPLIGLSLLLMGFKLAI